LVENTEEKCAPLKFSLRGENDQDLTEDDAKMLVMSPGGDKIEATESFYKGGAKTFELKVENASGHSIIKKIKITEKCNSKTLT